MRRRGADQCVHEWVVFSTALQEHWLMLQCVACGQHGVVEDPTRKEWCRAFSAPARPYRWRDSARVRVKGDLSNRQPYVMRTGAAQKCDCYAALGVPEPGKYERVPAEIIRPGEVLTEQEREELVALADVVRNSDLCSRVFLFFLQSFQQDTGREVPGAAYRIARRISSIDARGIHCSAAVVARLLLEYVKVGTT